MLSEEIIAVYSEDSAVPISAFYGPNAVIEY
jgi:hypothetical protein